MNHSFPEDEITLKEALAIVLKELAIRLPKTNKDGFLPIPIVYDAIARIQKELNNE
tara:strand:+ start:1888 stop:2055 length:168 start_codon:yes stop_codon:yes gene_type:complete